MEPSQLCLLEAAPIGCLLCGRFLEAVPFQRKEERCVRARRRDLLGAAERLRAAPAAVADVRRESAAK
eukprot:1119746-Heterocapsa_arctica.AAC.1